MFSPSVSSPLTFMPGSGLNALNCSTSSFARFWNSVSSAGVHQSRSLPSAVEAAALVVEAVADLVADHRADRAVVHRIVRRQVEERRLENRGGEDDLVLDGVVVRVDRLRRHQPLVAIDRLAELADLVLGLDVGRALDVADEVVGLHD